MLQQLTIFLEEQLRSGSLLIYVAVFLGGIAASVTPCTYPVLPLTVSFIGNRAEGNRRKAFTLSLALIVGMASVYAVLGLAFAALRKPFGALQSSGPFLFAVALFFVLMSLMLLDVFTFPVPRFLSRFSGKGRNVSGYLGAFLVGGASGLMVGPCTGPILAVVLASVSLTLREAQGADWLLQVLGGGVKLFLFGLGQGALILLAGTFSGFLSLLPRAGMWMNGLKKAFALLILLMACLLLLHAGSVTGFDPLARFLNAAESAQEGKRTDAAPAAATPGSSHFGGEEFLD